jgi:ComF family protein
MACKDGLVKGEDILCTRCILELPRTDFHKDPGNPIFQQFFGRIRIRYAFAFLHYRKGGKVQRLLHELKYFNKPQIGNRIGMAYGAELAESGLESGFDCIVPMPLHPSRQRRRGYNQSEGFAQGLARTLRAQCVTGAVLRSRPTETQTRKSRLKRWENVESVFVAANPDQIRHKRVLLVDDVITTGSTVEACGHALLSAGCSELSIAGIAYAHK